MHQPQRIIPFIILLKITTNFNNKQSDNRTLHQGIINVHGQSMRTEQMNQARNSQNRWVSQIANAVLQFAINKFTGSINGCFQVAQLFINQIKLDEHGVEKTLRRITLNFFTNLLMHCFGTNEIIKSHYLKFVR